MEKQIWCFLSLYVTWLAALITYAPRPLTHLIRSVFSTQAERCLLIAALLASSLIQWNWIMEVCSDPSRGQRSSRNGQFAGWGQNWYDIWALNKSEFSSSAFRSQFFCPYLSCWWCPSFRLEAGGSCSWLIACNSVRALAEISKCVWCRADCWGPGGCAVMDVNGRHSHTQSRSAALSLQDTATATISIQSLLSENWVFQINMCFPLNVPKTARSAWLYMDQNLLTVHFVQQSTVVSAESNINVYYPVLFIGLCSKMVKTNNRHEKKNCDLMTFMQ